MRRLLLVATVALAAGIAVGAVVPTGLSAESSAEQQPNASIESVDVDDDGRYLEVRISEGEADTVYTTAPLGNGTNEQLSAASAAGDFALVPLSYGSLSTYPDDCGYNRHGDTVVELWTEDHRIVDTQSVNITAQVDSCNGGER